jgi:murein L,D-transpeptidase YafK
MTAAHPLHLIAAVTFTAIAACDALAEPTTAAAAGCVASVAALPASPLFEPADPRLQGEALVVVLEEARRARVYRNGILAQLDEVGGAPACWTIALGVDESGQHPTGPKRRRGDRKTPHGWYRSSDKPWSNFAPAVAIHYPNAADARSGLAAGLVSEAQVTAIEAAIARDAKPDQKTRLGGEILFHGGGAWADWTWGCVALDDDDNEAFRSLLPADKRTDVLILP